MEKVDVLICGSGSAGLCAATWLAKYGVRCKVLERRDGPMQMGQADGVQCRTVEIFESFGVGEELLREAYHVLEVNFWAEDSTGIKRTGRTADTQPGLSHQPHVILNQARINGLLLDLMKKTNNQQIDYGYNVTNVEVDSLSAGDPNAYPVKVTAEKDGKTEVSAAKYALACDGAHSIVRKALGYRMIGDSSDAVWGVMDMVPRTDFPDIRKKSTIRSKSGNILIIPREGENDNLTRFYIELPPGTNPKEVTLENLQAQAQRILSPYKVDFVETVWWSAYAIGQRHADFFHKDHRVFLAGDACHTHSPKAGQGMNVSLQDGYNIGWKLGEVLTGLANPSLLETYVLERQKVAIDLINFDRHFSKLFSSGAQTSPAEFQQGFIQAGKYTAGLTATYDVSSITCALESEQIASQVTVGMRLPSAQVVRFCDSKPMQLMQALKSDGRWRIMAFVGNLATPESQSKLVKLGDYLDAADGPVHSFTPRNQDSDSLIETIVIGHGVRHDVELEEIPKCFYPISGKNQTRGIALFEVSINALTDPCRSDLHKLYYDDESYNMGHGHAYEHLGIDPVQGAIIIVRPDQYVSAVMGLGDYQEIGNFFSGFLNHQTAIEMDYNRPKSPTTLGRILESSSHGVLKVRDSRSDIPEKAYPRNPSPGFNCVLQVFFCIETTVMDTLSPPPKLTHLFTLRCAVDAPMEVGHGPYGRRRCVPIKSGSVQGKFLNGEVVPGGADFITEGTRAGPPEVLQALMEGGPVDPSQYWFHLHVKIETGHEKYKWMNNRVIVGRATRAKGEVAYDAYFLENSP
ncbi:unnamed protein product [Penicillium salamii]|uniref:Phenol 2-monooxygenase n=1 Tax=Penicillium salamii TaxID=1612424 RepID=A0A9W4IPP7_9EURO|nr:unnamed protein product [Penicillium salamii]CAG8066928.1 unnamed protein product [Penicillium salamii]CAG8262058.1 unnamed protein product [Penicillium salamii]CAG8315286.1 unnamed protein product [Penicillium salamii]CAG8322827.1 unnamed protein product [Penicillium salamii]